MRLRDDVKTARQLTAKQWGLLLEAGGSLVVARLAVCFVPFRRLAKRLGDEMAESPAAVTAEQREAAIPIGWAVRTLGRRLPWMSQCLVQSVAITRMLQRRDIPSTLYFGVARDTGEELKAHSWVRVGQKVLTGAKEREDFSVVATFAPPQVAAESELATPPVVASICETGPEEADR